MAPDPSQKKKKKNAPDRPQPKWLHPPDEENPILNPKPISEERKAKDKEEWDNAVKFLKYHSVEAPMKAPPPAMLLTLVGAFLTSHGFNSASRLYTTQLASRGKLDAWKVELGVKLPKGFPDLVKIFKDWYKVYQEKTQLEITSSDNDDGDSKPAKSAKTKRKIAKEVIIKTEETSSSGSSNDSSDEDDKDDEMEGTEAPQKSFPKTVKARSSSSSPQTSDSDADNEEESEGANLIVAKSPSKASSSNSSSPSPSSSSSSGSEPETTKLTKSSKTTKRPLKKSPKAKNQPSEKPAPPKPIETSSKTSTDSSVTLQPTSPTKLAPKSPSTSTSSSSSSSSSSKPSPEPAPETTTTKPKPKPKTSKRKHTTSSPSSPQPPTTENTDATEPATKKQKKDRNPPPQRFQRVPSDTKIDPKLASNAYRKHDYGDRAHQDLSVTRGKGFTKEKNKKKRGSYRGGAIDVTGGKGVKFEGQT